MSSNTIMSHVMSPLWATFHFCPIQNAAIVGRSGRSVQKIAPIIVQVSGLPVGTLIIWPLEMFENWLMSCLRQTDTANLPLVLHASLQGGGAHDIADDMGLCTWSEEILACTRVPWTHGTLGDVFSLCCRAWGIFSLIETFVPHIHKWVLCLFWYIPQCNDGHVRWIY